MSSPTKSGKWFSVSVTADKKAEIVVETAFGILNSLGTEVTFGNSEDKTVHVIGYFDAEPSTDAVKTAFEGAFEAHRMDMDLLHELNSEAVVERDWLAEWKQHWKPTVAGAFIVAPPWEQPLPTKKILIKIEPAMAFGTGTHETTRLCLEFISNHYSSEMSFLDVGTGTGILSIAAARLYSGSQKQNIFGCDTDPLSIEAANENALLNRVPEIKFEVGSVSADTPRFDFVCANMTVDIITPLLKVLIAVTRKKLILSGILVEQEEGIRTAIESFNVSDLEVIREGEWIGLAVTP